jgi:hypothetical protein
MKLCHLQEDFGASLISPVSELHESQFIEFSAEALSS